MTRDFFEVSCGTAVLRNDAKRWQINVLDEDLTLPAGRSRR